jgi:plasmid replication initiation protein
MKLKDRNKNADLTSLVLRQNYLVTQANDLARAFGNLRGFEHRLLDYCLSYVTKDDDITSSYTVNVRDVLRHFDLNYSGPNYERVANAFRTLNEKTALYFDIEREGKRGVRMGQLFGFIDFMEDGEITFKISEFASPYVFALKEKFYSFKLGELAKIKSKYGIILLKLWESNRFGKAKTTKISGSLEEWQEWFLGKDKTLESARFRRDCLTTGIKEIEDKMNADVFLETIKKGRKVVGYEMIITDNRQSLNNVVQEVQEPLTDDEPETEEKDNKAEIDAFLKEHWPAGVPEKTTKAITQYLSKYQPEERLNVLSLCYAIYCKNNGKKPGYITTLLREWDTAKLTTLSQTKEFYTTNHGPIEFDVNRNNNQTNVPKRYNPNYVNDTTDEEKADMADEKARLMERLNNLGK